MANFSDSSIEFAKRVIDLYGGVEKAREAILADYNVVANLWNQNSSRMGRILRAHLFVEHYLTLYLESKNFTLGSLEKARLSFAQKTALANVPNSTESYLFPGIRHLNKIRNRIAHSLNAELNDADCDAFLSIALFKVLREELASPNKPSIEPIDVLEDFAKHAGIVLSTAAMPDKSIWSKAFEHESEGAT